MPKIFVIVLMIVMSHFCFADEWTSKFDIEGDNPIVSDDIISFSAISSQYLTTNGHGWRNELKKKKKLRTSMYSTHEKISAKLSFNLDAGNKTIITQYHEEGTGTVVLLYVSDFPENKMLNGIYNDGVFDVYVRYTDVQNQSKLIVIGTINSGDTVDYSMENNQGDITLMFQDESYTFRTKDASNVYLKFGDYLQAQSPETKTYLDHDDYAEFYENVVTDMVTFNDFNYTESD